MPDEFDDLLDQYRTKPNKKQSNGDRLDQRRVAEILYDELGQLGYDEEARVTLMGNFGRENSYNINTIFRGHKDPDNKADNIGIISWQGDRNTKLKDFIRANGGDFTPNEQNLRLMTRFMDKEWSTGYKNSYRVLRDPKATRAQKARAIRDYILYEFTDRKTGITFNTPDGEFDAVANRQWFNRVQKWGVLTGQTASADPFDQVLDQYRTTPTQPSSLSVTSGEVSPNIAQASYPTQAMLDAMPNVSATGDVLYQTPADAILNKSDNPTVVQPSPTFPNQALPDKIETENPLDIIDSDKPSVKADTTGTTTPTTGKTAQTPGAASNTQVPPAVIQGKTSTLNTPQTQTPTPQTPAQTTPAQTPTQEQTADPNAQKLTLSDDQTTYVQTDDQNGVAPGKTRVVNAQTGETYIAAFSSSGTYQVTSEKLSWAKGDTAPVTELSPQMKASYDIFRENYKLEDTEELRQKYAANFERGFSQEDQDFLAAIAERQNDPNATRDILDASGNVVFTNRKFRVNGADEEGNEYFYPEDWKLQDEEQRPQEALAAAVARRISQKYGVPFSNTYTWVRQNALAGLQSGKPVDLNTTTGAFVLSKADIKSVLAFSQKYNQEKDAVISKAAENPYMTEADEAELFSGLGMDTTEIAQVKGSEWYQMAKKRREKVKAAIDKYQKEYIEANPQYSDTAGLLIAQQKAGIRKFDTKLAGLVGRENEAFEKEAKRRLESGEFDDVYNPDLPWYRRINREQMADFRSEMASWGGAAEYLREMERIKREYGDTSNLLTGAGYRPLGRPLEFVKNTFRAIPNAVSSIFRSVSITANIISGNEDITPAYKDAAYKIGDFVEEITNKYAGQNPDLRGELVTTVIPDVFGQVAIQTFLGYITGGATAPTLLGMAMGTDEQYKNALRGGATPDQRRLAAGLGGLFAVSDYFLFRGWSGAKYATKVGFIGKFTEKINEGLIARGLKKETAEEISREMADGLLRRLGKGAYTYAKGGVGESVQETSESWLNDLVAYQTYDPSEKRLAKLQTFFGGRYGDAIGGFFGGLFGAKFERIAQKAAALKPGELSEASRELAKMKESLPLEIYEKAAKAIIEAKGTLDYLTEETAKMEARTPKPGVQTLSVQDRKKLSALGFTEDQIRTVKPSDVGVIWETQIDPETWTKINDKTYDPDADNSPVEVNLPEAEKVEETPGETTGNITGETVFQDSPIGRIYTDENGQQWEITRPYIEDQYIAENENGDDIVISDEQANNAAPGKAQSFKDRLKPRNNQQEATPEVDKYPDIPPVDSFKGTRDYEESLTIVRGQMKQYSDEILMEEIEDFTKNPSPYTEYGKLRVAAAKEEAIKRGLIPPASAPQEKPQTASTKEFTPTHVDDKGNKYAVKYSETKNDQGVVTSRRYEWEREDGTKGGGNFLAENIKPIADQSTPEEKGGKIVGGVPVDRETQERRKAERRAETDALTGVANRAALDKALPTAEKDANTSVISFDANNFGQINKKFNEEKGDEALKGIAAAIKQAAEEEGVGERVFRRGGDEFVVLAPKEKAEKVRARAEEIYGDQMFGDIKVSLTGTVGDTFTEANNILQKAKGDRKRKQAQEDLKPAVSRRNVEADGKINKAGERVDPTDENIKPVIAQAEQRIAQLEDRIEKINALKNAPARDAVDDELDSFMDSEFGVSDNAPKSVQQQIREVVGDDHRYNSFDQVINDAKSMIKSSRQYIEDIRLANEVFKRTPQEETKDAKTDDDGFITVGGDRAQQQPDPKKHSLATFVRLNGGISTDSGIDTEAIKNAKGGKFILRKNGKNAEDAFRDAVNAGYFYDKFTEYTDRANTSATPDFTLDDFINAVAEDAGSQTGDKENRGGKYFSSQNSKYHDLQEQILQAQEEGHIEANIRLLEKYAEAFQNTNLLGLLLAVEQQGGEITKEQENEIYRIAGEYGITAKAANALIEELQIAARTFVENGAESQISDVLDESEPSLSDEEIDDSFDFGEPEAGKTNLFGEDITPPQKDLDFDEKPPVSDLSNWREEFDAADPSRKNDILRAIADVSKLVWELSDVLERAVGLSEESNIVWAVLNNPAGKKLIAKAKTLAFTNPNTSANIDLLENKDKPAEKDEVDDELDKFLDENQDPAPAQAEESEIVKMGRHFAEEFLNFLAFDTIKGVYAYVKETFNLDVEPGTRASKQIDEALEVGAVLAARQIVADAKRTAEQKFTELVELYNRLPRLEIRTSTSVSQQAYSTPAPLAFAASQLAGITKDTTVYEPTAGNGMLLIGANPVNIVANELNEARFNNLHDTLPGAFIGNQNAVEVKSLGEKVDVVIANPPFGSVKDDAGNTRKFRVNNEYTTTQIDHAISLAALENMKDDGRAVLIVGSVLPRSIAGRKEGYNAQSKRAFYYTLYNNYNVTKHFTVDGKLYERQGASFPVDVVVIEGRGKSAMNLPGGTVPTVYENWNALKKFAGENENENSVDSAERPGNNNEQGSVSESGGGRTAPRRGDQLGDLRRGVRGENQENDSSITEPASDGTGNQSDVNVGQPRNRPNNSGGIPTKRGNNISDQSAGNTGSKGNTETNVGEELGGINNDVSEKPGLDAETVSDDLTKAADILKNINFGNKPLLSANRPTRTDLVEGVSEEVYEQMRPAFEMAMNAPEVQGKKATVVESLQKFFKFLKEKFSFPAEWFQNARQYFKQFVQDVRNDLVILKADAPQETELDKLQVPYRPKSGRPNNDTLLPVNMQQAVADALDAFERKYGNIDEFVARELGMTVKEIEDNNYFNAEQIDAIGLAIANFKEGKGFIIGDQTGVGKGRVNAAIVKWALANNLTPIFLTEKPNLYADMFRDLKDIGYNGDAVARQILMTNNAQKLILEKNDDGTPRIQIETPADHSRDLERMANENDLGEYAIVFSTYYQQQYDGGQPTARHGFMDNFTRNAVLILDESHNAGGTEGARPTNKPTRSGFIRFLVSRSRAVFYSSATFAKRPSVMDLYSRTDINLAFQGGDTQMVSTMQRGGVPLQQIIGSMLAKAGQYLRREKTFEGISFDTVEVETNREKAEAISVVLKSIFDFDRMKQDIVRQLNDEAANSGTNVMSDGSIGQAGVQSSTFSSIMHNLIGQMTLGLKLDSTIDRVIEAHNKGEKPVIALASTMESFLNRYADEFNIKLNDTVNADFGVVLDRYLERTREITEVDPMGRKSRRRLTDEELGDGLVRVFNGVKRLIANDDWSMIPLSPIDHIHARLAAAGIRSSEITGRKSRLDYTTASPTFKRRPGRDLKVQGKNDTINGFNSGDIDVLIINQSGATGLSLHASDRFADQKPRVMFIAQAEANIDTFMQMLGRINRTGQVVLPRFELVVANIPAEKRPAAVLAKKLASLNATTTGKRQGKEDTSKVFDFINEYGDEIVCEILEENPDLHARMGNPIPLSESGAGLKRDGAARKATGYLPMLPLKLQAEVYDIIADNYETYINQLSAMGENMLEAKTYDLRAKEVNKTEIFAATGESPFAQAAHLSTMDIRRLGKPFTKAEVIKKLQDSTGEESDVLSVLQHHGERKTKATIEAAEADFDNFLREEVGEFISQDQIDEIMAIGKTGAPVYSPKANEDSGTVARKQRALTTYHKFVGIRANFLAKIADIHIGKTIQLISQTNFTHGIITEIKRKGVTKNPLAQGDWEIKIAVTDASRQISVKLRRFESGEGATTDQRLAFALAGNMVYVAEESLQHTDQETGKTNWIDIIDAYDQAQGESRETRYMITGNVIAGYGKYQVGQFMYYTDANGQLQNGVLLPRTFNPTTANERLPVMFNDPKHITGYILRHRNQAMIHTADGNFSVQVNNKGDYVFQADGGTAKGGVYFLNRDVTNLYGDFTRPTRSGKYKLTINSRADAEEIIRIYQRYGAAFQADVMKPEARRFLTDAGIDPLTGQAAGGSSNPLQHVNRSVSDQARIAELAQISDIGEILKDVGFTENKEKRWLEATPEAVELVRSSFDNAALKENPDAAKQTAFDGIFLEPEMIDTVVSEIKELEQIAKESGYTAEEIQNLKDFRRAIVRMANLNKGTVVLAVNNSIVPHEKTHQASFTASKGKNREARYKNAKELERSGDFIRAREAVELLHGGRLSLGDAIEEVLAYLATGDDVLLGLSEAQALNLLVDIIGRFEQANGREAMTAFSEVENERFYATLEEQGYVEKKESGQTSPQNTEGESGGGQTSDDGGGAVEQPGTTESESPKDAPKEQEKPVTDNSTDSGEVSGKQEKSSFPKTMRRRGYDQEDILYTPQSHEATENRAMAKEVILGRDAAIDRALSMGVSAEDMKILLNDIERRSREIRSLEDDGLIDQAVAKRAELAALVAKTNDILINIGRAEEIVKTLAPLSAEAIIVEATRLKQVAAGDTTLELTEKESKQIEEIAKKLEEAQKDLARAERRAEVWKGKAKEARKEAKKNSSQKHTGRTRKTRILTQTDRQVGAMLGVELDSRIERLKQALKEKAAPLLSRLITHPSSTTQIATTTGTYLKGLAHAISLLPHARRVLDYGAGRGLASDAMRNQFSGRVDSFEPYPDNWEGSEPPTYTKPEEVPAGYDVVLNFNVLNVLEKPIRDEVVKGIYRALSKNGVAILNARKWKGDVNGAKNFRESDEAQGIYVIRKVDGAEIEVFQKGFDGNQLVEYIKEVLPDAYVEKWGGIANGVIISKSPIPSVKKPLLSAANSPQFTPEEMDELINVAAKILHDGLASIGEYGKKEFAEDMRAVFGDSLNPIMDELNARASKRLQAVKRGIQNQRTRNALQAENPDATDSEIEEMMKERAEKAKEKAKVRGEHAREARKFDNAIQKDQELREKIEAENPSYEVAFAAYYLMTETGKTINSTINAIMEEFDVTPGEARQIAAEGQALKTRLTSTKKEVSQEEADARTRMRKGEMELRSFLTHLTERRNAMQRFNNALRTLWVGNLATQIFNGFQTVTTAMPGTAVIDVIDSGIRATRRKFGKSNELDKISPNIRARDAYLPIAYSFSSIRARAENVLSYFPDEFFRIYHGLQGDIDLGVEDVDHSHLKVPRIHKGLDYIQKYANFMAKWSFAQVQEGHFRSAMFMASLEQVIKNDKTNQFNIPENLKGSRVDYLFREGRISEIPESWVTDAADKAMEVTFASEMPKKVKEVYDTFDRFLPVFLNPVAYARFTYTISKGVANMMTFGAVDAIEGKYTTKSAAKGMFGVGLIAIGAAFMAAFGGDDDEWFTVYFDKDKQYPVDVRRWYPVSAFLFMGHALNRLAEGRKLPPLSDFFEAFTSIELGAFEKSPGFTFAQDLFGALWKDDPKSWNELPASGAGLSAMVVSSLFRYGKPFKDLIAEFSDEEGVMRKYSPTSVKDQIAKQFAVNIPGVESKYNAEKRVNPTTGEPMQTHNFYSMFGLRLYPKMFTKPKLTKAEEAARDFNRQNRGDYGDGLTEEQKEVYSIISEIDDARRTGELTREEAKAKLRAFKAQGKIDKKKFDAALKLLDKSELEEYVMKMSYKNANKLAQIRSVLEKATPAERQAVKSELNDKWWRDKKPSPEKNDFKKMLKDYGIFKPKPQ